MITFGNIALFAEMVRGYDDSGTKSVDNHIKWSFQSTKRSDLGARYKDIMII